MSLEDLPPLREALDAHGLWAKKAFGQHFLLDLNITRKIARLAELKPGDRVIEVGPGPGGLTRALLETGAQVTAIEKDQRFGPLLEDLAATGAREFAFVSLPLKLVGATGAPTRPVALIPPHPQEGQ